MSETLNEQLAGRIRELRMQRRLSHEQLAAALRDVGVPWTRQVVAKLENGRRQTLTLEELHGLALVLDVPPLALLYPIGKKMDVEVLPGHTLDAWDVARWFTGEARLPLSPEIEMGHYAREFTILKLLRRHDYLISQWHSHGQEESEWVRFAQKLRLPIEIVTAKYEWKNARLMNDIRATREEMRGHGIEPPRLPLGLILIENEKATVEIVDGQMVTTVWPEQSE
jgi:transcriptional regulator with XRE-family HTH domain